MINDDGGHFGDNCHENINNDDDEEILILMMLTGPTRNLQLHCNTFWRRSHNIINLYPRCYNHNSALIRHFYIKLIINDTDDDHPVKR